MGEKPLSGHCLDLRIMKRKGGVKKRKILKEKEREKEGERGEKDEERNK